MLVFVVFQVLFTLGSSFDIFDENCLISTNLLRRRHGVPDLTWSEALAADARKWATFLAESDTFEHDYSSMQDKHQGENLAFFKPYKAKCQGPKRDDCVQCREIVDGWYDEVKNYDFGMGKPKTPGGVVMHFTQEVWKNSHQFGIGTAKSNKYGFIAVARYSPRGNRGGPAIFKDNVFPPGTISDPTASVNTSTQSPPTPTRPGTLLMNDATAAATPASGGGSIPTPLPSATSPNTGVPKNGSATVFPPTREPLGPAPKNNSQCQYFVVNSTTSTYAVVQKCRGRPNVTLIPEGTARPTKTTKEPSNGGGPKPTSVPLTTKPLPLNPCEPNPCKNGGTCEVKEGNATCTCPEGYWGPLCQDRGPNADESKDALMLHNMYRAMHQAPLLTWNKEMAAKAQDWADKLAREQRLIHENESATDYGENLAEVGSDDKALLRAIDAWYTEVGLYNFKEPKFSKDSGHFSQLVWGASNELGMAKAKTKDNLNVYVVARYKPAGNVVNLFESNVKPKQ